MPQKICLLAAILISASVWADPLAITPQSSKIASCDDYATRELGNSWDMSDNADINNYFPDLDIKGFSTKSISNGYFSAIPDGSSSAFYLFSPKVCGSYPVGGRWGQNIPVDVTKYKTMSIRMYTDKVDPYGIRLLWDRDCNYANMRTGTSATAIPIQTGWHTYTVNLAQLVPEGQNDSRTWTQGSITGFAVLPTTQAGANVVIDWIRLEDPSSCNANVTIPFDAGGGANDTLVSLYLDDDTNPFNGYARQLVTAQTAMANMTTTITDSVGLIPASYNVVGLRDSDFTTLEYTNPWDMNDASDIIASANISGLTFSNGTLSGTADGNGDIYLNLRSGFSAAKYLQLSLKASTSTGELTLIYSGTNPRMGRVITQADSVGGNVFQVDMSAEATWTGTINEMIIRMPSGAFSLDFVSIRGQGYDMVRSADSAAASVVAAANQIAVNAQPLVTLEYPNSKGGEALRPWNMNNGDLPVMSNLDTSSDGAHSGEAYTNFLPDVRPVSGIRGDFFKGSNSDGSPDPVNYSTFPIGVTNPISFSADDYRNLCFKLMIDRAFSLGGGSVARVISKAVGGEFITREDIVLITDGWSNTSWYEYCVDMKALYVDGLTQASWDGTIEGLRVDAHEFTPRTTYYFDWIKLRKDAEAPAGKFNIVYDLYDPDDSGVQLTFYYSSSPTTLGTAIGSVQKNNTTRVYEWNTSAVPAGRYYIHTVATDGTNSVTRYGSARVVVSSGGSLGSDPVLNVEAPAQSQAVCDVLQLKGYALQADRFEDVAAVEVLIDGVYFVTLHPNTFSPTARSAYPDADSSNSGFNSLYSAAGLAAGSHTITLKAYSSHGPSKSEVRTIVKQASGCAAPLVDADPAGVPVPVDGGTTTTPTLESASLSSAKHAAVAGKFSVKVGKIGDAGCTLTLLGGSTKDAVTTSLVSQTVTAADVKKKSITLLLKSLKVGAKGPAQIYLSVAKSCSGTSAANSKAKGAKLKRGTSGAKNASKVLASLRKLKRAK